MANSVENRNIKYQTNIGKGDKEKGDHLGFFRKYYEESYASILAGFPAGKPNAAPFVHNQTFIKSNI